MDPNKLCLGCFEKEVEAGEPCAGCGYIEPEVQESPHYLPPRTLLRESYLIGRVLGQGGFGITYLAWDINLNIKLAIKEYFPQELVSRTMGQNQVSVFSGSMGSQYDYGLEKFIQEARTLAQFEDHPNIVSVRSFFQENSTAYMVMNFVEGVTLKQYLSSAGEPLPVDTALRIMVPVSDALREVHSHDLLHRDISPDNILINKRGQVVLIDFGAARQAVGEKKKGLSIILKPGYAPEEQYRSAGKQGPWTDVYALGATFYHLITGRKPDESLDRLVNDTMKPPSQLGVAIAPYQEAALLKALAVRADDRFQSIEQFQGALLDDVAQTEGRKAVEPHHPGGGAPASRSTPAYPPVAPLSPTPVSKTAEAAPSAPAGQSAKLVAGSDNNYLNRGGVQYGPYRWSQLEEMSAQAGFYPGDLIWRDGDNSWQPLEKYFASGSRAGIPSGKGKEPARSSSLINIRDSKTKIIIATAAAGLLIALSIILFALQDGAPSAGPGDSQPEVEPGAPGVAEIDQTVAEDPDLNGDIDTGQAAVPLPDAAPTEVVNRFLSHTLGSLPGSSVNQVEAKKLMTESYALQFTSLEFVPRTYGIQDGPSSARIASEDIHGSRATVNVIGVYPGSSNAEWRFTLNQVGNHWRISSIEALHDPRSFAGDDPPPGGDFIYVDYVIVDVDTLRLRSGPGTSFAIIDRLSKGTALYVYSVQYVEEGGETSPWLEVETPDGTVGWVNGDFVSIVP